jgi:hypothetical protein
MSTLDPEATRRAKVLSCAQTPSALSSLPASREAIHMFPFRFDPAYAILARNFGITGRSASVYLTPKMFAATYGPWKFQTALENIRAASVTGPYRYWRTAGPARVSLRDGGLTFATNSVAGVRLDFFDPVPGIDPFGAVQHPNLTVTIRDIGALMAALSLPWPA